MTIYYIKQDDTIWGCGEPGCCGEYYEEIKESFVNCECDIPEDEMTGDHLWSCNGGGPVLKWRKAKKKEIQAFENGGDSVYYKAFEDGAEYQKKVYERANNAIKPKRDRTVHQLVEEGYTVAISGAGATETYYAEDSDGTTQA
jgi:hypothetical protein